MGRRRQQVLRAVPERGRRDTDAPAVVHDSRWVAEAWVAAGCSAALLLLLTLVDWVAGGLDRSDVPVWAGLAVLLFVVLVPRRLSAGEGWLASRGLLGVRRVRTDRLVSVRRHEGVDRRIVLRDAEGGRLDVDPRVLLGTPGLWYRLETDARASARAGTLLFGGNVLTEVTAGLDAETARSVFRMSGLE